jgi:Fe-S-cluster containining protein
MVRVQLRVLNNFVSAEMDEPDGPQRLDQVLPLLRQLDDAAIDLASEGKAISCCKGCSACCRAQPVPVSPQEAYAISRVVDALEEPRAETVREAFRANSATLDKAGLRSTYLNRNRELTPESARELARRYFSLGLVCPFLVDDACSIYADRPFVCRQYLVTSPAEHCRDPFTKDVHPIDVPLAGARASLATAERFLGPNQVSIPLALALDYVELHREELERTFDGKELFEAAISDLASA